MLTLDPHPLLELAAFVTTFPRPLEQMPAPESLTRLLRLDAVAPLKSDDAVREQVRALLRHGGYKPTGRGKPASEYLDRAAEPLRVGLAPEGASYLFNLAGQSIDLAGLLCLFDAEGPCANAVKDAQRTKTTPGTTRTLSLVWGTNRLPGRAAATAAWYRELLHHAGAATVTA